MECFIPYYSVFTATSSSIELRSLRPTKTRMGGEKGDRKGQMECFTCGGPHMARDCPEKEAKGKGKSVDCFNCGGNHFARDCPERNKGKGGGGGGKTVDCFICGGNHFARDCPDSRKGKGGKSVDCFICGDP